MSPSPSTLLDLVLFLGAGASPLLACLRLAAGFLGPPVEEVTGTVTGDAPGPSVSPKAPPGPTPMGGRWGKSCCMTLGEPARPPR
uniref:Putative secreted protein n=1 Tax=Ixodes ricinus TaxID=34613 RepID=A0A6B0UAD1_IXORI